MSGRKGPADDTSVPVDILKMLLHSLEEALPRTLELRERLHAALFRAAGRSEGSLPKPLAALFQPSEEAYPSGADLMVREGALREGTGAIVAAHVHPEVPWGSVSVEAGPVNASSDNLHITVEGSGGHGAYPHRAHDPILTLSHAVVALQSLVSRRLDPTHAAVFSVGWMRSGSAENVIPGVAFVAAASSLDQAPLGSNGGEEIL